jgi:hypothetical protein
MTTLSIVGLFPESFTQKPSPHQTLGEEFSLCGNGNMVFHWADFHETCEIVKASMNSSLQLQEDFKKREKGLERLSLIPIWIKNNRKVHQMTMFDLYDRHILNHETFNADSGPMEVSFISSSGPFKEMFLSECFNNSTYRDFILVYLLKNKLAKRNYRIRLKSKVLVEYGAEFEKVKLINIDQMTSTGLLLSIEADIYQRELKNSDRLRFLIDTHVLEESLKKSLPELKEHLAQHTFNLLYSSKKKDALVCDVKDCTTQFSFDFTRNRKVYVYVPYSSLAKHSPEKAKVILDFVSFTKHLVLDYYKDLTLSLRSA